MEMDKKAFWFSAVALVLVSILGLINVSMRGPIFVPKNVGGSYPLDNPWYEDSSTLLTTPTWRLDETEDNWYILPLTYQFERSDIAGMNNNISGIAVPVMPLSLNGRDYDNIFIPNQLDIGNNLINLDRDIDNGLVWPATISNEEMKKNTAIVDQVSNGNSCSILSEAEFNRRATGN